MTNKFSKQTLAKVQRKKNKGGTVTSLLSKKKTGEVVKQEPSKMPPTKCPASPTSSLKMIVSGGEEVRKKKKSGGKSFLPTFWDDADAAALKAHEALSVDDLSLLMVKSSSEGGSLQALGESLFVSGKFLDLAKKVATSKPLIRSLSAENETFKNKVAILIAEAENDKERVATLEKSLQVEKDFCKLKDKQISDLELKLQSVGATAVQDFKDSDEYSNDLCKYYVEGFDLLVKWMAKHNPGLDLFGLAVGDVEKELMSNRPSEAMAKNVTEEAIDVAGGVKEAIVVTPVDPVPEDQ
nr:hypothetical protein CFP56_43136 [Quercus suber]